MPKKLRLPRVPLPRQTGGAHRVRRELSAREELTLRLNELHAEEGLDPERIENEVCSFPAEEEEYEDDYYDYLLDKLENAGGGR